MPSNKYSSAGQGDYLWLLIRTIETDCYVPADDDDVDDMWEESVADMSLLMMLHWWHLAGIIDKSITHRHASSHTVNIRKKWFISTLRGMFYWGQLLPLSVWIEICVLKIKTPLSWQLWETVRWWKVCIEILWWMMLVLVRLITLITAHCSLFTLCNINCHYSLTSDF